jgi:hypothetical protein
MTAERRLNSERANHIQVEATLSQSLDRQNERMLRERERAESAERVCEVLQEALYDEDAPQGYRVGVVPEPVRAALLVWIGEAGMRVAEQFVEMRATAKESA